MNKYSGRYAQINLENGRVISDSYLGDVVVADELIPIPLDFELGGKKYDLVNKEWVDDDYVPTPTTPEPSQLDRIETALNELAAGSVSTSAVDEAITEGVNDV